MSSPGVPSGIEVRDRGRRWSVCVTWEASGLRTACADGKSAVASGLREFRNSMRQLAVYDSFKDDP